MSSPDTYGAGEARQKQKDRLERARSVLGAVEARHVMRSVSGHDLDKEARNLRAHGVYHVKPTVQEMLEALAATADPEDWVAVVAVPDIGWEAAQKLGIDPRRVVVISHPQEQSQKVVAAVVEGFDVVVLGEVAVGPREQRALAGRARKLNTTILTMWPWQTVSKPFVSDRFAEDRDRVQAGMLEVFSSTGTR